MGKEQPEPRGPRGGGTPIPLQMGGRARASPSSAPAWAPVSLTLSEKCQVPGLESRLASLAGGAVAGTDQPSAPRPPSPPQKGKERHPPTSPGQPPIPHLAPALTTLTRLCPSRGWTQPRSPTWLRGASPSSLGKHRWAGSGVRVGGASGVSNQETKLKGQTQPQST